MALQKRWQLMKGGINMTLNIILSLGNKQFHINNAVNGRLTITRQ